MRLAKFLAFLTLLSASALCVSAQDKTPKIVWKNLQEKYESFYDVIPVIFNAGAKPIYFDCSPPDLADGVTDFRLLQFNEETKSYLWNVMVCGTLPKEMRKAQKKEAEKKAKLMKAAKYVPAGCKLNPQEEFAFNFTNHQWNYLIWGDGSVEAYKSGKFIFTISYEMNDGFGGARSPEFSVIPKEETK